jgi:hypothetical protein
LIIPESIHDHLLKRFQQLATRWGFVGSEVKGRLLNEEQFAQLIGLVYDTQRAFLRVAAVDMGLHTEAMIADHKRRQVERLREPMDERFHPSAVTQVFNLASQLEGLAPQLYVETVLLTELVMSVIQTATLLYSQLEPATLSRFCWRVDAKDKSITAAERLWKTLVLPFIQSATLKDRIIFLTEGDYSHFAPFENSDFPAAPVHLQEAVQRPDETFSSFSVNRVCRTWVLVTPKAV